MLIGPSFADIFKANCLKIGLLPIELPEQLVRRLMDEVDRERGSRMAVDLEARTITSPSGETLGFEIDDFTRAYLLEGLDEIGRTLVHEDEITAFEAAHRAPLDTTAIA